MPAHLTTRESGCRRNKLLLMEFRLEPPYRELRLRGVALEPDRPVSIQLRSSLAPLEPPHHLGTMSTSSARDLS